ncbi:MAG: hypothetical protein ACOCRK_09120 [bacterium]
MLRKSILFFSFYGHQKRYYNQLCRIIKERDYNYNAYHINVYKSIFNRFLFYIFPLKKRFDKKNYTKQDIDEIISYTYKKNITASRIFKNNFIKKIYKEVLRVQAICYLDYFYNYFLKNKIDIVIVWNGLPYPQAALSTIAKKMNIKTVFMENGYLPNTLTVDPKGVNYYSSLSSLSKAFYDNISINKNKIEILRRNIIDNSGDFTDLPEKFILLPLQVYDDTQVLIHSPLVRDMPQLIEESYKAVDNLNLRFKENYHLVIKEHPQDIGRINYDYIYKKYSYKNLKVFRSGNVHGLLKKANAVITINSTVGIEALLHYKPVITLGNAFYNIKDLVYNVDQLDNLSQELYNAIRCEVNKELIDKFLYFLRYEYLLKSGKKGQKVSESMVIKRIVDIIEGNEYIWS